MTPDYLNKLAESESKIAILAGDLMKILIPILLVALVITLFTAFAQEQVDITGRFVGTWNIPNDEIPFKIGDVLKGYVKSQKKANCCFALMDMMMK